MTSAKIRIKDLSKPDDIIIMLTDNQAITHIYRPNSMQLLEAYRIMIIASHDKVDGSLELHISDNARIFSCVEWTPLLNATNQWFEDFLPHLESMME